MSEEDRNYFWEKQQKSIPFLKGLPDQFKVHDELIKCPWCNGEMFGRCLCCQCYFCHDCEDGNVVTEEEILEEMSARNGEKRRK